MSRSEVPHSFKVVFKPEPDGSAWNASIPSVRGCHSHGRSLAEARRNIREALAVSLDDEARDAIAAAALFEEDVRLPAPLRQAVQRFERTRAEATKLKADQASAARVLAERFSLRDAGELLGISQEGVRQLLKTG